MEYRIVDINLKNEKRYIIIDEDAVIVEDARGFGYKTKESASKMLWYKFKNGKKVLDEEKNNFNIFKKQNKLFINRVNDLFEYHLKSLAIGETEANELIKIAEEEFEIKLPTKYLKYL